MKLNKITIALLAILLGLGTLTSCKKVDPFTGADNFFLTFELNSEDGTTYKGTIGADEITVNVPSNVPLTSLKAKYSLSELAKVSPKPEEVKNWNDNQTFTVTSYNGTKRAYTVALKRTDYEATSTIHLTTDKEVSQFAAKGVNILVGNLVLGAENSKETITTLEPLKQLKEVRYNLVIHKNVAADLSTLSNLERVGSIRYVGDNKSLKRLNLPKLRALPNGLTIESNTLEGVSFASLEEIGNVTLKSKKLTSLDLPKATAINGDLDIRASELKEIVLPELTSAYNISFNKSSSSKPLQLTKLVAPKLARIGKISLIAAHNLETLALTSLNKAEEIYLNEIKSLKTLDLSSLTEIKVIKVKGDYQGKLANQHLKELAFPKLVKIQEIAFYVNSFANLESFKLPVLKEIEALTMPTVKTTYEAPQLEKITKHITIYNYLPSMLEHLSDVNALQINLVNSKEKIAHLDLSSIKQVKEITLMPNDDLGKVTFPEIVNGKIILSYNSNNSTKAPQMDGVKECKSFSVELANNLKEIELPASLTKVTEDIRMANSIEFVTAKGLKEIGKDLFLKNASIKHLDMPMLEKVGGDLNLQNKNLESANIPQLKEVGSILIGSEGSWDKNTVLTNINFLSGIQKTKKIFIRYCTNLTDFSGIKQLVENGQINKDNWNNKSINNNAYNPTFEDLKAGKYTK